MTPATFAVLPLLALAGSAPDAAPPTPGLSVDTSQAEAVLAIAEGAAAGRSPSAASWSTLFESLPYRRLEKRELSLSRPFSREDFERFVLSPELATRTPALRATLKEWAKADLAKIVARIQPYLPAAATIRASIYPVIKPRSNSFVFEAGTDPAIFLYVDPETSPQAFGNTVAHELHHVGLSSLDAAYEKRLESLPANARQAARWIGAFGEGLAVLAAAGSVDVHPLRDFPESDRLRWDEDMTNIDQLLGQVDRFLLDIAEGGFTRPEVADRVAFTFFGYRGPWYTVGYHVGATIERKLGRQVLLECLADPRLLLTHYNTIAQRENRPRFSEALVAAVAPGK
jgi:hypothetical protein